MPDIEPTLTFKVRGYKPIFGDVVTYVIASSIHIVEKHFSEMSPEEGGYIRWSTEPVEEIPEEAMQSCPSCSHGFNDPRHVLDLTP